VICRECSRRIWRWQKHLGYEHAACRQKFELGRSVVRAMADASWPAPRRPIPSQRRIGYVIELTAANVAKPDAPPMAKFWSLQ
jgi:hypothetical protein